MPLSGADIHFCEGCKAKGVRTHVEAEDAYCAACLAAMAGGIPEGTAAIPGPPPQPPPAPTDPISFVKSEIARWQKGGLISARLAQRLLLDYTPRKATDRPFSPQDDWPRMNVPMTPGMVLLYLGGILILTAALMLVSQFWQDLGRWGRFALVLMPTAGLYAYGGWRYSAAKEGRLGALVMVFFGCLVAPLAFGLGLDAITQGHVDSGGMVMVALASLALHLASLYLFRSPVLTIPYPLALLWVFGQVGDASLGSGYHSGEERLVFGCVLAGGLILVAIGAYLGQVRRHAYAAVPDLVGSFAALLSIFILGVDHHEHFWQALLIVASLGALAASVYRRNQTYLFAGAIFLMVGIFSIGFEYFENTAGLPLTLLICGALTIAVGFGVQRVRKEYMTEDGEVWMMNGKAGDRR